MPWEFTPADIAAHSAWLHEQGYAASTIAIALDFITLFYRYCADNQVDPQCIPGYNPAAAVPRPRIKHFAGVELLSQLEVDALLSTIAQDSSPLGLRNFAFFFARLHLGVRLHTLLNLQWRQFEIDGENACVRWRPAASPAPLPAAVWNAIHEYLLASGRLPLIQPGDYIFAPLTSSHADQTGDQPKHWISTRPIRSRGFLKILQHYGRIAGLPAHKLNLRILRDTALRLRLDGGASIAEMHAFMDVRDEPKGLKYRLGRLPPLPAPPSCPPADPAAQPPLELAAQVAQPNQPVPASIHSLYARSQPAQAVRDLMEQNDLGVDQEMLNLRTLGRIMLELLEQAASAHEIARLSEAYISLASLVSEMLATQKSLPDKSADFKEHLNATREAVEAEIDREWALWGLPPGVRPPLLEFPENESETTTDACEEIASTRLVLRRLLDLALRTDQARDFLYFSLLYTRQCRRLVRILRHEAARRGT